MISSRLYQFEDSLRAEVRSGARLSVLSVKPHSFWTTLRSHVGDRLPAGQGQLFRAISSPKYLNRVLGALCFHETCQML